MKKLFSVLLALLMMAGVVAVAPVTASAAAAVGPSPTTGWSFYSITEDGSGTYGAGSWSWVQATKTLTLNNINYSTTAKDALFLPDASTIELIGENTITSTWSQSSMGKHSFGVHVDSGLPVSNAYYLDYGGDLTITGSGSLDARSGTEQTSAGIAAGNLTINGSTVTATGGGSAMTYSPSYGILANKIGPYGGNFAINGGTVTATSGAASNCGGIHCYAMTVFESTVNATGGDATVESSGIYCNGGIIVLDSTVNATGGGLGIFAFPFTLHAGTVTAAGSNTAIDRAYTVPGGYKYYVNTTTAPSAVELTGNGSTTVIGSMYKYAKIVAHAHTPGPAATCTTAQTCTICGTQLAPATGHAPDAAATCTTAQTCTVCSAQIAPAKGHTAGPAATCTTAQTCTVCSAQIAPAKGHTPGPAATCTTAQTCTVCSAQIAPATGHTAGPAATCTTAQTCTVCSAQIAPAKGHTPGPAATCTTAQTCTVCSAVLVPATGHTPGAAATCTTAQTCTACSAVLVPATGHDYLVKQNTVAPTYDEQGYTIYKCSRCTATEKRDFTAKLTRPDPPKKIFTTRYDATFINWILFFLCFGFLWMWF